MNGITILNEIPKYGYTSLYFLLPAIICFAIGGIMFLANGITLISHTSLNRKSDKIQCIIGGVIVVVGIVLTVLNSQQYSYTDYQCIIDDTASFNEVVENYEIIDKQGEIWTLRGIEKEG